MNVKADPPDNGRDQPIDERAWQEWLASGGRGCLDWAGEVYEESNTYRSGQPRRPRLSEVLVDRLATLPGVRVYQVEFGARDFETGWIVGQIVYDAPTEVNPERQMVADYRQEWTGGYGYWSLVSWTVGPFRPVSHED